jgi:hypothetical protein
MTFVRRNAIRNYVRGIVDRRQVRLKRPLLENFLGILSEVSNGYQHGRKPIWRTLVRL